MSSLEKAFNKLTTKEIHYLFQNFCDDIASWYNGDLDRSSRKRFVKAISLLRKFFPENKCSVKVAYRAFEDKREIAGKRKLSKSTKPCASFSKDIKGLFSFIEGGGVDSIENTYIARINVKKKDILIDTESLIEHMYDIISFIRSTKNTNIVTILKDDYGSNLKEARSYIIGDFKQTISRLKDFKKENEIILKTDNHLSISKLIDPLKLKDIIKHYLLS